MQTRLHLYESIRTSPERLKESRVFSELWVTFVVSLTEAWEFERVQTTILFLPRCEEKEFETTH